MTREEIAWNKARVVDNRDPEHYRQDKDDMLMCRDGFNRQEPGGWTVDEKGKAVAYLPHGKPAMGDQPLSSVDVSYV